MEMNSIGNSQHIGAWISVALRQSLKMLEMSDLELQSFVQEQVLINPFLEVSGEEGDLSYNVDDLYDDAAHGALSSRIARGDALPVDLPRKEGLRDLLWQECVGREEAKEFSSEMCCVIDYIDNDGYLTESIDEIVFSHGLDPGKCRAALLFIKNNCSVIGVGSVSLREFLLSYGANVCSQEDWIILEQMLCKYYDEFSKNKIHYIAKQLRVLPSVIERIKHIMKSWPMSPAYMFKDNLSPKHYIVPDLVVLWDKHAGVLRPQVKRRFKNIIYNTQYASVVQQCPPDMSVVEWESMKKLRDQGKNLIKNLGKRVSLIEKVGAIVCNRHKDFLTGVSDVISPMTMRDVAAIIGVHDSLINRTVMGKYISTPVGILPLRQLFARAIESTTGDSLSTHYLETALRNIISKEDKGEPLSDEKLSLKLAELGIVCARRTVSKYRLKLKLQDSSSRKKYS